jgi:hypothetical protein
LLAYQAKTNTYLAQHTLLIAPTNATTGAPPGFGYILITNAGNSLSAVGALADGVVFSQYAAIGENGAWPFYASPKSSEWILGWITNLYGAEMGGALTWTRAGSRTPGVYAGGFTNSTTAQGLLWDGATPGVAVIELTSGQLIVSDGGLTQPLVFRVMVNTNNALIKFGNLPTNSLSGSINPNTGFMNVTFGNGIGRDTQTAFGAVLQTSNSAAGFFTNKASAGSLMLLP